MTIQKFAAHYMLSPEGCFLKWPVISVRDDGQILDIQTSPHGLKEQAGISFFSGILVPAFIDIWLNNSIPSPDNRFFNRHFSQGTLIMRKPKYFDAEEERNTFPLLCSSPGIDMNHKLASGTDTPLWDRMKALVSSDGKPSFQELLHRITARASSHAGISNAGKLEPDSSPGLLVIRNADLTGPVLTPGAQVKWLSVPSISNFESLTQKTK